MKTKLLFQEDSYLREFTARVLESSGNYVVLDATAFHPTPYGGLDTDTGYLESGGLRVRVVKAEVRGDVVAHIVEPPAPLAPGSEVRGVIDWDKRYNMMRLHTAAHVIASVMYRRHGALITGGHITPEYSRDDFDITIEDWKKAFEEAIAESNEIIGKCVEVKIYWLPRGEAVKREGIVKLAERLPPEVEKLRIVEIPGIDIQADGGPHVRNTCEIGEIKLLKIENRGKRKKRIYYTLKELADKVKI